MNKIDRFVEEYRWLSNFWGCEVYYEGVIYPTSEHAYQAAKTIDPLERYDLLTACVTPGQAKRYKKHLTIREDWQDMKLKVMKDILRSKFEMNPKLCTRLLETGHAELIEGNTWNDVFWGVCNGEGENHLGKILMELREDFAPAEEKQWLDIPDFLRTNPNRPDNELTLTEICERQYDWVERMGWHNKTVLEALALVASEVGEAVNECRGEIPSCEFRLELADIILRVADLAQWQGIDLNACIREKMLINEKRGTRGRRI